MKLYYIVCKQIDMELEFITVFSELKHAYKDKLFTNRGKVEDIVDELNKALDTLGINNTHYEIHEKDVEV